jgi:hypothetical protein
VPTLIRLIVSLVVLAGIVYAAMFALATFVEPRQKNITVDIPTDRLGGT